MQAGRPTIAIITDWLANSYTDPAIDEATLTAHEAGANVIWLVDRPTPEDLATGSPVVFDLLSPDYVDAVLVLSFGYAVDTAMVVEYCERLRPMPMCTTTVAWEEHPRVLVENTQGMSAAVAHLIVVHDRRRLGFIGGPAASQEAAARFSAYRETLAAHRIPFDPARVVDGDYSHYSGLRGMRKLLDAQVPIDAVVCANDGMAFGALQELEARGIAVPGELAVVGFDDIEAGRYLRPALTTVRQPIRKQARAATQVLLDRLAGKEVLLVTIIDSELVLRRSCGCTEEAELERARGTSAVPPAPAEADVQEWLERLAAALEIDVRSPSRGGAFLTELHAILESLQGKNSDATRVHRALTALRRRSPMPGEPEARMRADLIDMARVAVGNAGERSQGARRAHLEETSYKLNGINRSFVEKVTLASLTAAVADQLAWLGIPSLYLCLYEPSPGKKMGARLVLAVKRLKRIDLPAEGLLFSADRLLPDEFLRTDELSTYICCAIGREGSSPGYVLFERGPHEGTTYDVMTEQIGAALRRIRVLAQLVDEARRREAAVREHLEKEMLIARQIQTGIVPRTIAVEGLDIAAVMVPAAEVGGDYYDVIAATDGSCWLGIGDVAGHGLSTGLVMLMLQSVVSGVARCNPGLRPRDLLRVVNHVLFENVRERLVQDEHVTLTLIHFAPNGQLTFSGAHEDILFYRSKTRAIEWVRTPGTWVAARRDIDSVAFDTTCELGEGDLMVLYTDGATEARNAEGELFGTERLAAALTRVAGQPVAAIRDAMLDAVKSWMFVQEDDITLVVVRRLPAPFSALGDGRVTMAERP